MVSRILARLRHEPRRVRNVLALADVQRFIPDPERAALAFAELLNLQRWDLADAYQPAASERWNVWLDRRLAPPHGRRQTLEEWCAAWLAQAEQADLAATAESEAQG